MSDATQNQLRHEQLRSAGERPDPGPDAHHQRLETTSAHQFFRPISAQSPKAGHTVRSPTYSAIPGQARALPMATEFTANPIALEGNRSSITVIIEDYPGQGPGMGSTHSPGPALVTASADADPVTLLVLGWLAAKRSENTRTAYARDIGITPQRRASRAPSWLAWCQEQGVHPVTGVTGLHVARYARQLDTAGLSPASAARKLTAVSGWYAWLAQRGHIPASPAAGIARPRAAPGQLAHAGPYPRPGPHAHPRRRHRTRPAARPHRSAGSCPAIHRRPGVRGHRRRRRGPRHRTGTPGAAGHPRQRPAPEPHAPRPGCFPDRRLSRRAPRPDRRPGAVRHPDRGTAIRRRRMAGRAPPRHAGGPAIRPDQPPRTAHDAALIRGAVPRCRQVTPRPPERHGVRRPARHPAVRPGPAHPSHLPGTAPVTTPCCTPGPRSRLRTMAPRLASLPRPAAAALPPGIPGHAYHGRANGHPPPRPVRPAAWADAPGRCRLRDPTPTSCGRGQDHSRAPEMS